MPPEVVRAYVPEYWFQNVGSHLAQRHEVGVGELLEPVRVSQTWRDRLLGAGAGATLTLVAQWLVLVTAAAAVVILQA